MRIKIVNLPEYIVAHNVANNSQITYFLCLLTSVSLQVIMTLIFTLQVNNYW